jgi:hypothetical protein
MESRRAIRRNPKNQIASFRPVKTRKLAISKAVGPGNATLAQRLTRFFTDDYLAAAGMSFVAKRATTAAKRAAPAAVKTPANIDAR